MNLDEINSRHSYIENRVKEINTELGNVIDDEKRRSLEKEMGSLTYEKCITLSDEAERQGYVFYRYDNRWQVPGISEDRTQELVKQYLMGYGPNPGDCIVCDRYERGNCVPRKRSVYSFDLCPIVEEKLKEIGLS